MSASLERSPPAGDLGVVAAIDRGIGRGLEIKEWQGKIGPEAWTLLEKHVGKLV